jgi:NAD dependent epimerase/dehydratase
MDITSGKILVTGAGGFIGSHLVEKLLTEGCDVRAFVRYNSRNHFGHLEELGTKLKDIEVITGDVRDREAMNSAARDCSLIFHLAALIGIPYSYRSPADVFATNVGGTINVLDAARQVGAEKVIITSTSEVFGTPLYVPVDEKHPLQAQSPYAASKIAADKLAESYFNSYDLPVATVRPFNTFGPRQSARAVMPTIITQMLTNDSVKLGNLETRRDMLYVEDTVSAFVTVARNDISIGKAVNFGTGGDLSIEEMVEQAAIVLQKTPKIIVDKQRIRPKGSEVERLVCNYSLAQSLFNWQPYHSFEEGLMRTVFYIREHLHQYKTDLYNV